MTAASFPEYTNLPVFKRMLTVSLKYVCTNEIDPVDLVPYLALLLVRFNVCIEYAMPKEDQIALIKLMLIINTIPKDVRTKLAPDVDSIIDSLYSNNNNKGTDST